MAHLEELQLILPNAAGRLKAGELMSGHTTFRIGGPADLFFEPENAGEIMAAITFCRSAGIPFMIVGNGSNILVSDAGIRGMVLSIGEHFSGLAWKDGLLEVRAGTKLSAAASFAARQGYAGLEFASGIPGTMGGAIYMNAGAYDHAMSEIVAETDFIDKELILRTLFGEEHQFAYRKSYFSFEGGVVLQTRLRLSRDDPAAILDRMAQLAVRRKSSQPLEMPSAGSVFKRPQGHFTGRLIESCGLKGRSCGDAQVSAKHANFIVNAGHATADDVRRLIEMVQMTVQQQTGICLEPEIRFEGDWRHWNNG